MKTLTDLRKAIVKNSMLLTSACDKAGVAGWTVSSLSNSSKVSMLVTYYTVRHMMKLGYVVQLSNKRFVYAKAFKFAQISQIADLITKHWNTCVYSTREAHRAIPRPISHFTNEELEDELYRRNKL